MTDEALETIKLAWRGGRVVKKGLMFDAPGNEPRPVPTPAPPIWVGGASDKALERTARWGDGWIPHFSVPTNDPVVMQSSMTSMADFARKIEQLREARDKLGKRGPLDIAPGSLFRPKTTTRSDAERFIEGVQQVEQCGANWIWTPLPAPSRAAYLENVAWFGEEIVAAFAQ